MTRWGGRGDMRERARFVMLMKFGRLNGNGWPVNSPVRSLARVLLNQMWWTAVGCALIRAE